MSEPKATAWLLLRLNKPAMVFLNKEDADSFVEPGNDAIIFPLYRKLDTFEQEVHACQLATRAARRQMLALKQAMAETLGVLRYEEIEKRAAVIYGS